MSKYLIVGLGNPGDEYAHTRHNIGYDVVSAFILKHGGIFTSGRLAEVAEVKWKGKFFVCIKPATFMNLSGRSFKYWLEKEKIEIENSLTILDDLALPLNKLRLRKSGSDAGHNGLKDIQNLLGTDAYPKLRFGIGNNFSKGGQVDFVLSPWDAEEIPLVKIKIEKSIELIENFASIGIDRTMSLMNNLTFSINE
ncbi:MAG TPA: aminoacyl-tRNA hydrolase [Chitinophagaceae bacterium]|nr:aminoacyl-tRNA hydrolase [Chitinophagaceae bacterium]